MTQSHDSSIVSVPSMQDLMQAMADIGSSRAAIPSIEDLYDTQDGIGGYTKWRMPPDIRSALVSQKVEAGRGPVLSWTRPGGDYKSVEKLYVKTAVGSQELFVTDVAGIIIDCEVRPSLRGNDGEGPSNSVIGVCKDGHCVRTLPSIATGGVIGNIYQYSDVEGARYRTPSKELTSLKWQFLTKEGLLKDLILNGQSTAEVLDKSGNTITAGFDNRGMLYMYVTHVGVRTLIPSDADGNPSVPKVMNKEQALQNLITIERRINKKVFKSYASLHMYPVHELYNEDDESLKPFFLALNMSNGAMKGFYSGGMCTISRYLSSISRCKGIKVPTGRNIPEDLISTCKLMNDTESSHNPIYRNPSAWTTLLTLGVKEVQPGTYYSVPHFEGFDPLFGSSIYDGSQNDSWGDQRGINGTNVTYLSEGLRQALRYNFSNTSKVSEWDTLLTEAGFTKPEEFPLSSMAQHTSAPTTQANGVLDVSYSSVTPVGEYFVEAETDDDIFG
jgi:hypothetical protein